MINSKQRKHLSSLGQKIQPIFQVGKNGVTDITVKEIGEALDARELIKISVLGNCDTNTKQVSNTLCRKLKAEGISCVGNKIVIYRRSSRRDINHIEL